MDFFKQFFGFSDDNQHSNRTFSYQDQHDSFEDNNRFSNPNNDHQRPSFHVFSDPLHMHQYFEHQMNEMLKIFGFEGGVDNFFSDHIPNMEEDTGDNSSKDLRDQFLKSGYEKPAQHHEKVDKDIDTRVELGDLDSIFGRQNKNYRQNTFEGFSIGQSQSIKTIRNPDGSMETHRTVKDSEGREETTVCRKLGDKEYCITKRRDKNGKEEVIEKLINMSEEEKTSLFKSGNELPEEKNTPLADFPFDKFFR